MNVLVIEPGAAPYEKEISGLEEMQAMVGGLIATRYPFEDHVALVMNEDQRPHRERFNRSLGPGNNGIFGTCFICGFEGEKFCFLSPEQADHYSRRFHDPEIMLGAISGKWATMTVEPFRRPRKGGANHPKSKKVKRK